MSQKFERFGKYILLEKLAAGGMAEVFLARAIGASGIGKFLAIKRILPQFSDNSEFIEMFKDEAKIAINLSHSNIVSIFEIGASSGRLFLVMEYVEGRNLRQILNKMKKGKKVFSLDQIVYMVKEIAGGLDHAHRCLDGSTGKPLNITHRDMSPQNIMISFEGEIKIIDFGIAKAETQMETTRAGTLKGKFGYMSPEQAEGQPVDLRTDIFSLGIALWELLANDRLFIANNEINTLRKIRDCQVPNLRKINPNVPPELEKIVYKALARDRNLRYQTAAALHRDLNRFLNRHYPDFSHQDFAGIIKGLYADEILDNRNRLIGYAKKAQMLKPSSENSGVGETTFVTRTIGSFDGQNDSNTSSEPQFLDVETTVDSTPATNPLARQLAEMNAKINELNNTSKDSVKNSTVPSRPAVLDDDRILENLNKKIDIKATAPPSLTGINDDYGEEGEKKEQTSTKVSGIHKVSQKDDSYFNDQEDDEVTVSRVIRHPLKKSTERKSFNFMSLLLVVGTLIGGFVLLSQLYPDFGPKPPNAGNPETSPDKPVKTGKTPTDSINVENLSSKAPTMRVSIKSRPSGATIYIDRKNLKKQTPSIVDVPSDRPYDLTIKKIGYKPINRLGLVAKGNKKVIRVNLEKQDFATLHIDVLPPIHAEIYVNNEFAGDALPLNFSAPSNQPLVIKAINPKTGYTRMKKLRLKTGQSRKIIFKLTPNRLPSKRN